MIYLRRTVLCIHQVENETEKNMPALTKQYIRFQFLFFE